MLNTSQQIAIILSSVIILLIGCFCIAHRFNKLMQQKIEKLQEQEEALRRQSTQDPTTMLANRVYFSEYLNQRLQLNALQSFAIIAIGIDRFPQINHALGHHIGERLLHHVASRLSSYLTQAELIARLNNNVFIALMPHINSNNYTQIAEEIIHLFETPFSVYTVNIDLDVLLGFSFFPKDGENAQALIQKADVALYVARFSTDRYSYYQTEKDPHHVNKISLMSELREGLTQNEFEVYYQPQINLQKGKIEQVESLIRWQHPTKGFMAPEQFIPLAEETGHIKKLTLWLLESTILQCHRWQQHGLNLKIAINLSVKDLMNKNLIPMVKELLLANPITPSLITFEITETAFIRDPEKVMKTIRKLKTLGVHISIDDFGTGYSSLNFLRKLPIDEIKIDKSFIQDIKHSMPDAQIVKSIIALSHNLDLSIVAEGIDDEETFKWLKAEGCDRGQGFFFSPPLSLQELMQWVNISAWGLVPHC